MSTEVQTTDAQLAFLEAVGRISELSGETKLKLIKNLPEFFERHLSKAEAIAVVLLNDSNPKIVKAVVTELVADKNLRVMTSTPSHAIVLVSVMKPFFTEGLLAYGKNHNTQLNGHIFTRQSDKGQNPEFDKSEIVQALLGEFNL